MRKLMLFAAAMFALNVAPAFAIVHHCDYSPPGITEEVHDRHGYTECGNLDSAGEGREGTCEVSTSYFNTDMVCDSTGCIVFGKIDCGNNDKNYYFFCPGAGARVTSDRYSATCDSPEQGQDRSCTCGSCP